MIEPIELILTTPKLNVPREVEQRNHWLVHAGRPQASREAFDRVSRSLDSFLGTASARSGRGELHADRP
eukprot:scaffold1790_cov257-Pinguiococcus_pyrenoidosus.AAC.45